MYPESLVEDIKESESISKGVFVFELNFTRKLFKIVANPTFVSINPNLIPKKSGLYNITN